MRFATKSYVAAALFAVTAPLLAADELPKGEFLLDKFIEVTGGKAAYQKVHSQISTGSIEIGAMSIKARITIYQAEPAFQYTETVAEGIGKLQDGSNGMVAWSLSAIQGARIKKGDERAEALRESQMHSDVNWREHFTRAETVGVESVNGRDCYKVVVTPKVGAPQTRYYDKASNLLVKTLRIVKTETGDVAAETTFADYRKDGDLVSAHQMISKTMKQQVRMTIDSVRYNVEIPRERFDLPDEIRSLVTRDQ